MINRRIFLEALTATGGLWTCGGCRVFAPIGGSSRTCRDYFCTWETQRALWTATTCERDNLNEELLFGPRGWARTLFPASRAGIHFVLDDGWDVPYGADSAGDGLAAFGSLCPDAARFPSLKGTRRERLSQLNDRLRELGWKSVGLWIAAQVDGETRKRPFLRERVVESFKRRLAEAQEAGIGYWKVDWGVHSAEPWFRRTLSELAREYAPDVIVDHALGFDNALNGVAHPYDVPGWQKGKMDLVGSTGRMIGVPGFESVRAKYTELMSFSDSFRTYDTLPPMVSATALERTVFELQCADATKSACTINVEDEPLIGAALGCGIGIMRAAVWPDPKVPEPEPKQRRLKEIDRCLAWRAFSPVFGSDCGTPVRFSETTGREDWHYEPKSTWWSEVFGRDFFQVAPSVVSRGLALPRVRALDGENPLVCASRNPLTGALAVASLPLLTKAKGRHTPRADVTLAARLAPTAPLAVFGRFESVTLGDGAPAARIVARDLAGGDETDITARCHRTAGALTLPGSLLAEIGTRTNGRGDCSSPGTILRYN